jgi:hypothetical protein
MKPEIQAKPDQLFEKKNVEIAAAAAKSAQEQKEEEALRKFKEIRESIIRPTMQQFAEYLGTKGHATEIFVEEEKSVGPHGRIAPSSITLLIAPNSTPPNRHATHGNNPHFQVILDKPNSKAWLHESTMMSNRGGHAGPCGEVDLHSLTGEKLEPIIAKAISSIFG